MFGFLVRVLVEVLGFLGYLLWALSDSLKSVLLSHIIYGSGRALKSKDGSTSRSDPCLIAATLKPDIHFDLLHGLQRHGSSNCLVHCALRWSHDTTLISWGTNAASELKGLRTEWLLLRLRRVDDHAAQVGPCEVIPLSERT